MSPLKILLNNEIHLYTGRKSVPSIKDFIQKSFKYPSQNFDIKYLNEKKDLITIKNAQDFKGLEAKQKLTHQTPRLFVRPKIQKQKKREQKLVLSIYRDCSENDSDSDSEYGSDEECDYDLYQESEDEIDSEDFCGLMLGEKQMGQKEPQQQQFNSLLLTNNVQQQQQSALLLLDNKVGF